jgi:SnoaL-like domain
MTTREAFEKGTETFNAHDIKGFAEVLADEVVFDAPGLRGEGKAACADFFGSWFVAFRTRTSKSIAFTSSMTSRSRKAHSQVRAMAFSETRREIFRPLAVPSDWTTYKCSASAMASTPHST